MTREEKLKEIELLKDKLNNTSVIYLADTSSLNAESTAKLRRMCFNRQVEFLVVKNTLLAQAINGTENKSLEELTTVLKGSTSLMISEGSNTVAKLIKEFRQKSDKPVLKAAYVEESVYIGDDKIDALINLKSKNELIGDVIALLQSPAKTVLSQLQSGGNKIAGIVKTLSEKEA
jgi:large subunit ribosomal protein L10